MKSFLLTAFLSTGIFISVSAQSFTEGADLPGTGTGPAFTLNTTPVTIAGTLNTPSDGQDRFQVVVPAGCTVSAVSFHISDTANIGVNGFFQFGISNQVSFPPRTGSFTTGPSGPFPVGQGTYDCMAVANIAANDSWRMVFTVMCTNSINDPGMLAVFSVSPNPATDEFFIDGKIGNSAPEIFTLENMLGETVFSGLLSPGENHVRVSTAEFPPGIYFCRIHGELTETKKIIIQH